MATPDPKDPAEVFVRLDARGRPADAELTESLARLTVDQMNEQQDDPSHRYHVTRYQLPDEDRAHLERGAARDFERIRFVPVQDRTDEDHAWYLDEKARRARKVAP